MDTIATNTKVIVTAGNGQEFTGTIIASGTQAKVLMYAVLLDNPDGYPGLEQGVKVVEVLEKQVRLDTMALFGKDTYVDVTQPRKTGI
jgi:hypothetical protein